VWVLMIASTFSLWRSGISPRSAGCQPAFLCGMTTRKHVGSLRPGYAWICCAEALGDSAESPRQPLKTEGKPERPELCLNTKPMKIASLNVGLPREVIWHRESVTTGIFKQTVEGRVALRKLNLDGDRQADLAVHGGEFKAVYAYPLEHYDYWKRELPEADLPMGAFGENFTTSGMDEKSVHLGDRFSVGTAEVIVTQPRLPCYKLGIRFQSDDMVKRFLASGRMGFYFAVTREGEVGAGDEIRLIAADSNAVPVTEIARLYIAKSYGTGDLAALQRALRVNALPADWKVYFRDRLAQMGA
jgi:MOSC domain-containing protein YiiM